MSFLFVYQRPSNLSFTVLPVYTSKYFLSIHQSIPSIHQSPCVYPSKPFLFIHPSTPSLFIEILLVYPSKYFQSVHQINPLYPSKYFNLSFIVLPFYPSKSFCLFIKVTLSIKILSVYPSKYSLFIHQSSSVYPSRSFLFTHQHTSCLPIKVLPVYRVWFLNSKNFLQGAREAN